MSLPDRAALLFESVEELKLDAEELEAVAGAGAMAPRSDPHEKPSPSNNSADAVAEEDAEVANEDLLGLS